MKYPLICGCVGLAAVTLAGPSGAEETFPFLEPDAVRAAYDSARLDWEPMPDTVRDAFLVAEDRNFHDRPPARSTITAQITYWYPEPGGRRSLPVSIAIARALSREEILDWFVHGVFLGQGCFGIDGAAAAYFGKEPSELDLHEAALLAAIVPGPAQLHPVRFADKALKRRNHVLREMAESGVISAREADESAGRPLSVRIPLEDCASGTEASPG